MMGVLMLFACAEPRPIDPVQALDGSPARGEAQYQMVCAQCHGASGHGVGRSPALTERAPHRDDASILYTMLNGRGAMRGIRLSDQEASDILAYLRVRFPAHAP